jgi:hypothetical protein
MTRRRTIIIPIRQDGFGEPTLEDILSDPITEAVMRADAVDVGQLAIMLHNIAKARRPAAQTAAPVLESKKCNRSGLSERRI